MEKYKLTMNENGLQFSPCENDIPQALLGSKFTPEILESGYTVLCRMGDPELNLCVAYKSQTGPGGIFVVHAADTPLYAAIADTGLIFSIACGYFGNMTANTRYGVDIFEEMSDDDE